MAESSEAAAVTTPVEAAIARTGLTRQLVTIVRALYASPAGKALLLVALGIVVVVGATSYGQIRLNSWNKDFFDALSRRDMRDFMFQLGVFFIIAGVLLVLNVAQRWLVEMLKLKLREGMVRDLVGQWMLPRRAFWLAQAGAMGTNPDQRMHDDARHLSDMSADLSVGLLQASILFMSFAGVLWVISADFSIRISEKDYAVPGFMVWAAVLYAGLGSLLSYWVGRSLVGRNAERYEREAELRLSLVRVNEHLDGISLANGEAGEKRRVERHLDELLAASRRLVLGLTNLTWVTAGFGWMTTVAPILVAAPLYFSGKVSFGGLMMAAAAFTQAQSSLRWFVDNFSILADWRATLLRVANFRQALVMDHSLTGTASRIEYAQGEAGRLKVDNLQVDSQTGRDRLDETSLVVTAGERVQIVGAPGTAKTQLFRALAGLSPWGEGRVERPAEEPVYYMPRGTPYLPRGSLREVLAYPSRVADFGEGAFAVALSRLGLGRLAPSLDVTKRWDQELSQDEQLSLAFARIVLQAPPWLIIDDALGSLDDEGLRRVVDIFQKELIRTGVVHIGRAVQGGDPLFSRVVNLVKADGAVASGNEAAEGGAS
ncbi:glycosyl transferase family 1 [Panacagrimonas perspica]|uniref:ABC transporter ATP-binding protein/permease n=1 Tax=Panacagrimonas perspica TaxID=381431 RepID=UPI00105C7BFC|nr:ABC transporter ATP-binding protein/permease [Panacagrimonas perspica]THD02849.1 glycosyl transferase family 1 [Panacagrimonas perspica]